MFMQKKKKKEHGVISSLLMLEAPEFQRDCSVFQDDRGEFFTLGHHLWRT